MVLSDGHASRFDADVLSYLRNAKQRLYIGPADTTSVTQLLDQINQNLHCEYRKAKTDLFTSAMTINREGFMLIMAEIWKEWASRETIVASGKRVGISANGLNVDWMQQDKFDQAAACIQLAKSPSKNRITSTPIVQSPMDERP